MRGLLQVLLDTSVLSRLQIPECRLFVYGHIVLNSNFEAAVSI